jgi:hypothetical protein
VPEGGLHVAGSVTLAAGDGSQRVVAAPAEALVVVAEVGAGEASITIENHTGGALTTSEEAGPGRIEVGTRRYPLTIGPDGSVVALQAVSEGEATLRRAFSLVVSADETSDGMEFIGQLIVTTEG